MRDSKGVATVFSWRRLTGVLLAIAGSVLVGSAVAAQSPVSHTTDAVVRFLTPRNYRADIEPISRSIAAQLGDLNIDFKVSEIDNLPADLKSQIAVAKQVAELTNARIVIWYNLHSTNDFVILDPKDTGDRLVIRTIEETEAENPTEAMAVISRASILEILYGTPARQPQPRATTRSKSETVSSSQPTRAAQQIETQSAVIRQYRLLELTTGYQLHLFSRDSLLVHGADIGLSVHLHANWTLDVGYILTGPLTMENGSTAITLRRYPVRLGAHFWVRLSKVRLGFGVGAIYSFLTYDVTLDDPTLKPVRDLNDHLWSAIVDARLALPITERFGAIISAAGEAPLKRLNYAVEESVPLAQTPVVLAKPWIVQPRITVGLYLEMF